MKWKIIYLHISILRLRIPFFTITRCSRDVVAKIKCPKYKSKIKFKTFTLCQTSVYAILVNKYELRICQYNKRKQNLSVNKVNASNRLINFT